MNQEAIEIFLKRIQESQKARSKEVRITMQEALEVSMALSIILNKNNMLLEQIMQLQDATIKQKESLSSSFNFEMDGGKFRS